MCSSGIEVLYFVNGAMSSLVANLVDQIVRVHVMTKEQLQTVNLVQGEEH